ncbi:hypothetical protein ABVT39_020728 [Epinephelus coioides]
MHPLQDLFPGLRDAAHPKFDRESGVDCPNAILVLLLHFQELWMDIMPQTLAYFLLLLTVTIQRLTWEFIDVMELCAKKGLQFNCCEKIRL